MANMRFLLNAASILALVAGVTACSEDRSIVEAESARAASDTSSDEAAGKSSFSYREYDALLGEYVHDGGVDYVGLKQNRASLDAFVASMGALQKEELSRWTESERLAFWINAYNAITLQYVLNHYPIEKGGLISSFRFPENSIRQIPGVWDKLTTLVAGEAYTLNEIEHDVLRAKFDEPRIHVSIVCASKGCPPLRNEAYTADKLDGQLESQSVDFLSRPENFRIDRKKGRVYVSSIFSWFGKDFISKYGGGGQITGHGKAEHAVLEFVHGHTSQEDAGYLAHEKYRVDHLDYDWSLNERPE